MGDLFGGVTATVVALPVALAFGVASGLDPIAGIYGAIAVGFFAAVFGGTPSQISGPTGPMSIAMAVVVTQHAAGDLEKAFTIVIFAGLLQIALGVLRIGSFVTYTPYSVISGFMTGIGIIIMTIQSLPLLGADTVAGPPLKSIQAWPDAISNINPLAIVVGGVALAVGVFWPRRVRKYLPAPLAALIVGTLLSLSFPWFQDLAIWAGSFPGWLDGLKVIGEVPTGLPEITAPVLTPSFLAGVFQPAIIIALLGSIDSLLTSLVADSITRTRHNSNRELVGQGIGNMASGFIGGIPGAGATMGTVVNIRAGGRTPVSGVLRSVILVALVLGIGWVVEPIPHAVLAGILIKVGWDIIDWRFVTRMTHVRRDYLIIMLITFFITVFVDLVTAVALGLIAAGVARARESTRGELESVISVPLIDIAFLEQQTGKAQEGEDEEQEADPFSARVGLLEMRGSFTVASANELTSVVGADIEEHEVVIFNFATTTSMDDSAALVMEQLVATANETNTDCIVLSLSGRVESVLNSLNVFKDVPQDRFVDTLDEARDLARKLLDERNA